MLPDAHFADAVGTAYIDLLAAAAGASVARPGRDYGVDGTLQRVTRGPGGYLPGPSVVQFQLKTTRRVARAAEAIHVDVPVRAYNLVREREPWRVPLYLFVVCLRDSPDEDLTFGDGSATIQAEAFWWREPGSSAGASRSVRLRLPLANRLTPDALDAILSFEERDRRS